MAASNQVISSLGDLPHTVTEDLDRLEVTAGRIGQVSGDQVAALLTGLDDAYERIQRMEPGSPSRKTVETQFLDITARLRNEARAVVRNLGGAAELRARRVAVQPPAEHGWWYLDEYLARRNWASLRHGLLIAGIAAIVLGVVVVVYNRFFAPDPLVVARYSAEQLTRDKMMTGDLPQALAESEKGLQVSPNDALFLTLKGVILEAMGQTQPANAQYQAAEKASPSHVEFLLDRGQAYLQVNLLAKGLADGLEAVRLQPDSAAGYLLVGQAYETQNQKQAAIDAYNQAFDAATRSNQAEVAALARTRMAMLMQSMGAQPPEIVTATP